ncbi:MAG: aminoglycoside phosphotransferase family protein, partial [Candidatus Thorarchaeota archaeon]
MISDSMKNEINLAIIKKFDLNQEPSWKYIERGFINKKFKIIGENKRPLAICKIFTGEEEIYRAEHRYEREELALDIFGGTIAPEIIWKKKSEIIVYRYILGQELIHIEINNEVKKKLKEVLEQVHKTARNKNKGRKDEVSIYYQNIISDYKKSKVEYPNKLIEELEHLHHQQNEILDQFQEQLTYVHGDLVPPNFIFDGNQFTLIDWEFFRPELSFFDYQYFNYYAKAHKIPIK